MHKCSAIGRAKRPTLTNNVEQVVRKTNLGRRRTSGISNCRKNEDRKILLKLLPFNGYVTIAQKA